MFSDQALDYAFMKQKHIIKGLCDITGTEYCEQKNEISFINLIDKVVYMSFTGIRCQFFGKTLAKMDPDIFSNILRNDLILKLLL